MNVRGIDRKRSFSKSIEVHFGDQAFVHDATTIYASKKSEPRTKSRRRVRALVREGATLDVYDLDILVHDCTVTARTKTSVDYMAEAFRRVTTELAELHERCGKHARLPDCTDREWEYKILIGRVRTRLRVHAVNRWACRAKHEDCMLWPELARKCDPALAMDRAKQLPLRELDAVRAEARGEI